MIIDDVCVPYFMPRMNVENNKAMIEKTTVVVVMKIETVVVVMVDIAIVLVMKVTHFWCPS